MSEQLPGNLYKVQPPVENAGKFSTQAYLDWLKKLADEHGKPLPKVVEKMEETLRPKTIFRNVLAILQGKTDLWLAENVGKLNSYERNLNGSYALSRMGVISGMLEDDIDVQGIENTIRRKMFAIADSIVA